MGGSDQFGNIVVGIDLIGKSNPAAQGTSHAFGLTWPLVTKADGGKFGKTESGAIWLDPKKTSPYAFYQFWLNTSDADVYKFMNFFTFLPVDRISQIEATDKASGTKPEAQRILAEEATRLVHGEVALMAARRITECLFSGQLADLTENDLEQLAQDGMPGVQIEKANASLIDALVAANLAKSKSEARTFIQGGSVAVNGNKIDALDHTFSASEQLFGRFTVLRRGKKNYGLISWQ
jgi:tyrosyl-tRNA synthetase